MPHVNFIFFTRLIYILCALCARISGQLCQRLILLKKEIERLTSPKSVCELQDVAADSCLPFLFYFDLEKSSVCSEGGISKYWHHSGRCSQGKGSNFWQFPPSALASICSVPHALLPSWVPSLTLLSCFWGWLEGCCVEQKGESLHHKLNSNGCWTLPFILHMPRMEMVFVVITFLESAKDLVCIEM